MNSKISAPVDLILGENLLPVTVTSQEAEKISIIITNKASGGDGIPVELFHPLTPSEPTCLSEDKAECYWHGRNGLKQDLWENGPVLAFIL